MRGTSSAPFVSKGRSSTGLWPEPPAWASSTAQKTREKPNGRPTICTVTWSCPFTKYPAEYVQRPGRRRPSFMALAEIGVACAPMVRRPLPFFGREVNGRAPFVVKRVLGTCLDLVRETGNVVPRQSIPRAMPPPIGDFLGNESADGRTMPIFACLMFKDGGYPKTGMTTTKSAAVLSEGRPSGVVSASSARFRSPCSPWIPRCRTWCGQARSAAVLLATDGPSPDWPVQAGLRPRHRPNRPR